MIALSIMFSSLFYCIMSRGLTANVNELSKVDDLSKVDQGLKQKIETNFPICKATQLYDCIVCLSSIEQGEPARLLSCKHAFHPDCIAKWWLSARQRNSNKFGLLTCPMCRQRPKAGAWQSDEPDNFVSYIVPGA